MAEGKWYVVHTYSGYENKVANTLQTLIENRRLQDLIQEIKVPTEMVQEIKDGKEKTVENKLFPGYVFVKMDLTDDSWYIVRNTRGVTGFVGPSSKPVPLPQSEVDKLGVEVTTIAVDYKIGDHVEITDGPFKQSIAIVDSINMGTGKVNVRVNFLGSDTLAELDLANVKPI